MAVDRRALLLGGLALGLAGRARAQMQLDITRGQVRVIPIAVAPFLGGDMAVRISEVVEADLESSGLFRPIDRAAFIERVTAVDAPPRFADWRVIKAEALLVGAVRQSGDDLAASFRLWDPFAQKQLTGEQFVTAARDWRRLGHIIADAVYQRLTGEAGYFDTRIVFIDESGPKQKRVKRLAIMDQDGANVRMLTRGENLVLTPRFSPTSQQITYTSYEGGQPRVYLLDLETGQRRLVDNFPGMTFAPRFKPGGTRIIMSLQEGSDANLYEIDIASRRRIRLTGGASLDTGPSYAPDGRWIVFESDRGGSQQLFVMADGGGDARRISFGEGSYSTPVWSPRGDLIAFTKRSGGQFLIGVMKPDGSGERILATGYHNEGPTWAPNGRIVMFFRESGGANGGPKLHSVDLTGHNERMIATPSFASDPAWSPLLG